MRIAFDITPERLSGGGVGTYSRELRGAFAHLDDVAVLEVAHRPTGTKSRVGRVRAGLQREAAWYPAGLARTARARQAELIHVPASLPARARGLPLVLTVHDAIPWRHPEWFTRTNALQQRLLMGRAIRQATRIITDSKASREDLVTLVGADPDRIDVVYPGISPAFSPDLRDRDWLCERFGITGPVVLSVSTPEPRKNLRGAVRAFAIVQRQEPTARLVLVGGDGWRNGEIEQEIAAAGPAVVRTGRLAFDDLTRLYASADCFLFPSLMEGFGFPPLEAMASGLPVVSSNRPCLPEIVGDAAETADPEDIAGLAEAVVRIIGDPDHASALRARALTHVAEFTWERCATGTVASYRRALSV